jgi:hypothetical protein
VAFLTLEDPNAVIKGSRDPLGIQGIWAAFARHVVTNLTTPSNSVRGFTTLLLGRYFAELFASEDVIPQEESLNVCLRMEQLSAYVRYVAHGVTGEIRGIERVRKFHEDGHGRVPIRADRRSMILTDQKVYGLWGLYSVPARVSGFLSEGSYGVTELTRQFMEQHYRPHLDGSFQRLKMLLTRGGTLDTRNHAGLFGGLAAILSPQFTAAEKQFYGSNLRDAARVPRNGTARQARFCRLLEDYGALAEPVGRVEMEHLVRAAAKEDAGLARALERICTLEALLAPADALFDFILTWDRRNPREMAAELREQWGPSVPNLDSAAFQDLLPEIGENAPDGLPAMMQRCANALTAGAYEDAVRTLLSWNEIVMEARGARPWAAIGADGQVDVRYRGLDRLLPERGDLPTLWRNSYFVDSLKAVIRQLRDVP